MKGDKNMSKAKDNMYTAMRWFDEHPNISIEEKVAIVYELWQNYRIDEDEEEELYRYVDPEEKVNNPGEVWYDWLWANNLDIPDIIEEQMRVENLNVLKEMIK